MVFDLFFVFFEVSLDLISDKIDGCIHIGRLLNAVKMEIFCLDRHFDKLPNFLDLQDRMNLDRFVQIFLKSFEFCFGVLPEGFGRLHVSERDVNLHGISVAG